PVSPEPPAVGQAGPELRLAGEELGVPEHGMRLAQADQASAELEQAATRAVKIPVEPADLVVLAIGVVVAALRPPQLVAAQQHRPSRGEEERGQEVAHLPLAQRDDLRIVGRALDAVVPAAVVVASVPVLLAVRLVVL